MQAAFVTGAGRGIGRAVAVALAQDGYSLALAARSTEQLEEVRREISQRCPAARVLTYSIDVSDEAAVHDSVQSAIAELGYVAVLFNNAGQYVQGSWDLSHAAFDQVMNVNLRGAFNCIKELVPHMREKGAGYIINVSSIRGISGFAGGGAYCASKFGLRGLSDALFREFVGTGIRVSTLCPSWVNTEMAQHGPMADDKKIQPEDIVKAVRFLLCLSPGACISEMVIQCSADPV